MKALLNAKDWIWEQGVTFSSLCIVCTVSTHILILSHCVFLLHVCTYVKVRKLCTSFGYMQYYIGIICSSTPKEKERLSKEKEGWWWINKCYFSVVGGGGGFQRREEGNNRRRLLDRRPYTLYILQSRPPLRYRYNGMRENGLLYCYVVWSFLNFYSFTFFCKSKHEKYFNFLSEAGK